MAGLWVMLATLALGEMLVPVQFVITVLLLRSAGGRVSAMAFIAGMTLLRLLQGAVFGLLIHDSHADTATSHGPGPVTCGILLAVALLLYTAALRQLLAGDDPDAPPPRWMTMTEQMTPIRAFLIGFGLLAVGAKFWVLTLGAISQIGDANLSQPESILVFLAFIVLSEAILLAIVAVAVAAPRGSAAALDTASTWLQRHNRELTISLGAVFGTWFLLKALSGLGIL